MERVTGRKRKTAGGYDQPSSGRLSCITGKVCSTREESTVTRPGLVKAFVQLDVLDAIQEDFFPWLVSK
jgi:hypothetical protein